MNNFVHTIRGALQGKSVYYANDSLAGSPESTHLDNTQLHNSLSSNDLLREQSTKRELISAPKAFSGRTVFDRLPFRRLDLNWKTYQFERTTGDYQELGIY